MNFVALPTERTMSIDNALIDLDTRSYFSNTVEIFAWHGNRGSGVFEYNDRPRILEKVTNLPAYQGLIRDWIVAAAALPLPLNLAQARQVMAGYVEALYNNKRARPITYGSWQYEITDEAIAYMTVAMATNSFSGNVPAALQTLRAALNANVDVNNNSANAVNGWSRTNWNNWNGISLQQTTVNAGGGGSTSGYEWFGILTHGHQFSVDGPAYSVQGISRSVGSGGIGPMYPVSASITANPIRWQPMNSSNPSGELINATEFRDALLYIVNQIVLPLIRERESKKNQINALPNIDDVIVFPATAGWVI